MKLSTRLGLLAVLGLTIALTGCSSSGNSQREINILHAQVSALTDELVRIDEDLQMMRSSMQDLENKTSSALSGSAAITSSSFRSTGTSDSVYRTPSGFELPSDSIQRALKNAGYYSGNVDGKIGSQTKAAIKSFQRDNGLTVDGVVGRGTWAKLKAYELAIK